MVRSILFVCLGNICRSPLAEAAMRAEAQARGLPLIIDSAGTGDWHAGQAPDVRAQATARKHGLDISHLRARQVKASDFTDFDWIFALDPQNLADLQAIRSVNGSARLNLLLDLVPGREGQGVTDPYYGDEAGFDACWADVSIAARAIADELAG